ncbi:uncharacterized protein [Zea mays]|uniref:uncharacterized protein n=1 Tax=Zea mays TaxID=4577 RepID=UPI0009AA4337|nr:uncharacterized protein LOC109945950 [Zea mays]|eukprot:XP_020407935.1 uncharacterized protein LOC109945950 [Zea mays]
MLLTFKIPIILLCWSYLQLTFLRWGIAYCVKGGLEKELKAMQYLERIECEYDQKISIDFYKEGDPLKPAVTGFLVFVSTPDPIGNKYYLGPAPLQYMARQIATANGPTGYNRDYLFSMEKALASISHEDDSIIDLANEVRKVLNRTKDTKITGANASLKSHAHYIAESLLFLAMQARELFYYLKGKGAPSPRRAPRPLPTLVVVTEGAATSQQMSVAIPLEQSITPVLQDFMNLNIFYLPVYYCGGEEYSSKYDLLLFSAILLRSPHAPPSPSTWKLELSLH